MSTPITPFAEIFNFFDVSVVGALTDGSARMIALISPLVGACFTLYVTLILFSYLRGADNEEPVMDFLTRMIGWGAVIVFGMHIEMYTAHVVPLIRGLGDDLASVVGPQFDSAAALDQMTNALIDAFLKLYNEADGVKQTAFACLAIFLIGVLAGIFMIIAIVYICLAKVALGILIAVGPLFIVTAMFPATRDLFKNWTGQCLNYAFLVMLFSFAAQLEIAMVRGVIPSEISISSVMKVCLICAIMIFVSFNLPTLAAQLAGGVGISFRFRDLPKLPGIRRGSKGGGSIAPN